jgi:hypothetical protein
MNINCTLLQKNVAFGQKLNKLGRKEIQTRSRWLTLVNPSHSGSRDEEDHGPRPTLGEKIC